MIGNIFRCKSILNCLLILILITSTFITFNDDNVSAVGETTDLIIKSPALDSKINTTSVVISGTFTSEIDKADLVFSAEENGSLISGEWIIDDTQSVKTWKFTTESLSEGLHTLTIKINEEASQTVTFTINTTLQVDNPTILVNNPTSGSEVNTKQVTISGTFDASAPMGDLVFTAKEEGEKISDSIVNAGDWTIDYTSKTWAYSTDRFEEGNHNITVEISNLPVSLQAEASIDFTKLLTRPYFTQAKIILAGGIEQKEGEDFTNVPLDSTLKVTVADDKPMNNLEEKIKSDNYNPIKILNGPDTIQGKTDITGPITNNGKYYYDITFDPNDAALKINKTYLVYIDPELKDDLENPIFTRLFKFTTMSNVGWDDPDGPETQKHASSNPHGHYQLNTNMCAACHSTHDSNSASLTGGSYLIDFNEQLSKDQPANDPSENYCMACHDGTLNAPIADLNDSKYRHNNPIDYNTEGKDNLKQPESCTSCHNPHLEWSEDNQNLLKDHYVYTHTETHPEEGLETRTVDSLETTCISCHDNIDFSSISNDKGKLETFAYNKSMSAKGTVSDKVTDPTRKTISDYSLCLRCHNAEKSVKATNPSDIETSYLKQDSGHNFTLPSGEVTQKDGSLLNGPIPCAECHETHGSNNLFNLREILGNNPTVSDNDKFKTTGTTWSEENERNFCLNCHNKGTEIYGKKALIDILIPGHQIDENRACSECHSDQTKTYKTFREKSMNAVHAPLEGVDPSN